MKLKSVYYKVQMQVWDKVSNYQIWEQVGVKNENQVWLNIRFLITDRVRDRFRDQIVDQVRNRLTKI